MKTKSTHRSHSHIRFGGIDFASLLLFVAALAAGGCGVLDRNAQPPEADPVESSGSADDSLQSAASQGTPSDSLDDASLTPPADSARVGTQTDSTLTATEVLLARIDSLSAQVSRLADSNEAPEAPADFFADIGWKLVKSLFVLIIAYYVIRVLVWILGIRA